MLATALGCGASISGAATRRVPSEYLNIQAAISAADSGDSIQVGAGLYAENLDTQGKRLTLFSEAGAGATVVDGGGQGSVLVMKGGGVVEGFTLRNGLAQDGGGIGIDGAGGVVLRNNVVEGNQAGYGFDSGRGGGIAILNVSNVLVEGNIIRNNYSGYLAGGFFENAFQNIEVRNNQISGNNAEIGAGGLAIVYSRVVDNLVMNNTAGYGAGGIYAQGMAVIESNTIIGNYCDNGRPQAAGVFATNTRLSRNIVAHNRGRGASGIGIDCSNCQLDCNDSWGNDYLDYGLSNSDTTGHHNVSLNPLFCDEGAGKFTLGATSPCAPAGSQGCDLIGAFPVACTVVPARRQTWGSLKIRYR